VQEKPAENKVVDLKPAATPKIVVEMLGKRYVIHPWWRYPVGSPEFGKPAF
jgi:hypothetical protein